MMMLACPFPIALNMHHIGFIHPINLENICQNVAFSALESFELYVNEKTSSTASVTGQTTSGSVSTAEFQQHPYCTHTILLIFLNSNFDCLRTSFGWGCRPCHRGKHFRFCSATSATTRQTSFRVHNHPVPTTSVEYLTVCELGKFNKSHKFYSYFRPILLIPKASCKPEEMSGRSS